MMILGKSEYLNQLIILKKKNENFAFFEQWILRKILPKRLI